MIILKFMSGETINIHKLLSNNIQSLTYQVYINKEYHNINSDYIQSIMSFYLVGNEDVLPFNYVLNINSDITLFVVFTVFSIEQFDSNIISNIKNTNSIETSHDISQTIGINLQFTKSTICDCLSLMIYLQRLNISNSDELISLEPIGSLINLNSLIMNKCIKITDLSPIQKLINLNLLCISSCINLQDITPISSLVKLHELDMANCKYVNNIEPLQNLIQLRHLILTMCNNITSLESLKNLSKLEFLHIYKCTHLTSIKSLSNLSNLRRLYIHSSILDCDSLDHLTNLKII